MPVPRMEFNAAAKNKEHFRSTMNRTSEYSSRLSFMSHKINHVEMETSARRTCHRNLLEHNNIKTLPPPCRHHQLWTELLTEHGKDREDFEQKKPRITQLRPNGTVVWVQSVQHRGSHPTATIGSATPRPDWIFVLGRWRCATHVLPQGFQDFDFHRHTDVFGQ